MMVVKDRPVAIGRRGNFVEISGELSQSGFTGVVEVSYRLDEISRARAVFINGKMVDVRVNKLISKTELTGDEALNELLRVGKCVADIYTIDKSSSTIPENETNIEVPSIELHATPWQNEEDCVEKVESCLEVSREEILRKYKIKEPSEEEIDAIIKKAVEDELEGLDIEVFEEFERLKEELKSLSRKYLGKLSKKVEESIDRTSFPDELMDLAAEIGNSKSLRIFIPKEKLEKLAEEMGELIKLRSVERINT